MMTCSCAHNSDGTVTTLLCPVHADNDPCLTMAAVTGRRRSGTIRRGVCTNCGHGAKRYTFDPVGFDAWRPTANAPAPGTVVVKVQPRGCPRNGSFGHCYVAPVDRPGAGPALVLLNSLTEV